MKDLASTCIIRESDETEWIRDAYICNMRNIETQREILSATISHSEALSHALIDKKGYFNHQKLTNMAKATIGPIFKSFDVNNQAKMDQSLNINTCLKCGNPFKKVNLNVCTDRDIISKKLKLFGHFANLCKLKSER